MKGVNTRIEEIAAAEIHGDDMHVKKLSRFLYLILRKKNWVLPCLCVSLGLNSWFLSVLQQGATMDLHVRGLQESDLILLLTCQQTGEKRRKWSSICPFE